MALNHGRDAHADHHDRNRTQKQSRHFGKRTRTGFSEHWPDDGRYLGTAERGAGAVPKLHFPGLHPEAAKWIVASRPVRAIGIDTASIDFGQSTLYEAHRALYAMNIPAFENLTALEQLPPRRASIVALPMKIKGGSGAPLRAIAILPAR